MLWHKLDYLKHRPFLIAKKFSDNTFKLIITGPTKIHRSFHVSLLETVREGLRKDQLTTKSRSRTTQNMNSKETYPGLRKKINTSLDGHHPMDP